MHLHSLHTFIVYIQCTVHLIQMVRSTKAFEPQMYCMSPYEIKTRLKLLYVTNDFTLMDASSSSLQRYLMGLLDKQYLKMQCRS